MIDKNIKGKAPKDMAWDLFVKTGNIAHYELYKKLKG